MKSTRNELERQLSYILGEVRHLPEKSLDTIQCVQSEAFCWIRNIKLICLIYGAPFGHLDMPKFWVTDKLDNLVSLLSDSPMFPGSISRTELESIMRKLCRLFMKDTPDGLHIPPTTKKRRSSERLGAQEKFVKRD